MDKTILLFVLSLVLFSCEQEGAIKETNTGEHSVTILNVKGGFDYTFTSSNGRALDSPDEINTLTLKIINEDGELVYDQFYHSWEYDSGMQIPDSIYIPDLAEGEYRILASTIESYYYYEDYCCDGNGVNFNVLNIDPYTVSNNPIYIGNQLITVDKDVEVDLEMRNISAKLILNLKNLNYPNNYFWGELSGKMSKGYSFIDDEFYTEDYAYTHVYYDEYYGGGNYYFLPRSFDKMEAYVENSNGGYYISNTFFFDETIEMKVGDALTVTIDAEEIVNNAGNGRLNWEAVQWNNIGELVFP